MWLRALRSVEDQQVRRMSVSASGTVAAMMLSWPSGRRVGGLEENRRTRREQVVLCRVRLGSGGAANQFQALRGLHLPRSATLATLVRRSQAREEGQSATTAGIQELRTRRRRRRGREARMFKSLTQRREW
jgi:hypothetical protein